MTKGLSLAHRFAEALIDEDGVEEAVCCVVVFQGQLFRVQRADGLLQPQLGERPELEAKVEGGA